MIKVFFFILLLSNLSCFSQTIDFVHIGVSDKPIYKVTFIYKDSLKKISKRDWENIEDKVIKLSKKDFDFLNDIVLNNITNVRYKLKTKVYPFGAFKVQIQNNSRDIAYVLSDRLISLAYFNKLILLLEENNISDLTTDEFKLFIKRIKY